MPSAVRSALEIASVQPVDALYGMAPFSSTNCAFGWVPPLPENQRMTCAPPPFLALDIVAFIVTLFSPCGSSTSESGK